MHNNEINVANSNIQILNSGFTIENGVLTGLSSIIVNDLTTNKLTASYAKIDFSNIGIAAIQKLFADSGIIRDLVVQQGHITGELVGVTIKGDLIESNTLKADKLVVKGSDGLYYKLNIDGIDNISTSQAAKFVLLDAKPSNWDTNWKDYYIISNNEYVHVSGDTAPTWNSNTYYKLKPEYESGLDGTNIVAKTITADKVSVNDLVAFGATIGGFEIGQHSIHSVGKTSVQSLAQGLYMDDSGQFSLGDDENYVVYEIDPQTGESSLSISADDIYLGKKQRYITDELDEIRDEVTTYLHIESSNGLCFKNNLVSTVLSVTVYAGSDRITNITNLRAKFGNSVYLQWKWKRKNDSDYGIISASDSRISENGFKFTLSPQDVDTNVTFLCELIN